MKRMMIGLAGLATLGGVAYLGSRVVAQAPQQYAQPVQQAAATQPASSVTTRVALINLGQVIKNYQKFKNLMAEVDAQSKAYQKDYETKRNAVIAKQGELAKPENQNSPHREQLEREIRDLQRQLQDLGEEAKEKTGKMEFDRLVQTYKEIQEAVQVYARARNLELVMHYNDGIGTDAFLPPIFQRKLMNGACWPMYIAPGMDITNDVTNMLNQRLQATAPAAPTGVPAQPAVQQ